MFLDGPSPIFPHYPFPPTPLVTVDLFFNSMFLVKCPPVHEWIKKLWYIYTMEYYTVERKKELLPFTTAWMELESIMLSEISQMVKDKYHMTSPINGT